MIYASGKNIFASLINRPVYLMPMELHRILTAAGAILLVATFLLNAQYAESRDSQDSDDNVNDNKFNYAYVSGAAMMAAFVASFAIFTNQKMKRGFAS